MKTTLLLLACCFILLGATQVHAATKFSLVEFKYDADGNDNYNRNGEYVTLKNISGKTLNLKNWIVTDNGSHSLTLPEIKLKKNKKITIYTGEGTNVTTGSPKKVYWGNGWGLWNNDHDKLTVKNKKGKTVFSYAY
ncbi:MAG: lamin tail domain-containing protein [Candidatus Kerfeldbacteria bacterium]|nr:lamin tail domain-containing protein [Candidatus Kerfeldbacteria bacterium]